MAKHFIFAAIFLISFNVYALESSFPASVEGTRIPNVHKLSDRILRGNSPLDYMSDLKDLGITDVLIFKNSSKPAEIKEEVDGLRAMGLSLDSISHVPFPWKNLPSEVVSCRMILDALRVMVRIERQPESKLYVHCSVGEDRTGLISGLYRVLNDGWKSKQAFRDEMCAHGYANASKKKPKKVADAIRDELTPLYVAVAEKIESGEISADNLYPEHCNNLKLKRRHDLERRGYVCK